MIENFISNCKLGDWFVLYQLSKNLNRPFFMDFITSLSMLYVTKGPLEEDPEDSGDNFMSMLLKPSYTSQESEVKEKEKEDDGGQDSEDEEDDEEDEEPEKPEKKSLDKPDSKSPRKGKDDDDDEENGVPCFMKKQRGAPQIQLKSVRIVKEAERYESEDDEDSKDVFSKTLSQMKKTRGNSNIGVKKAALQSSGHSPHPGPKKKNNKSY